MRYFRFLVSSIIGFLLFTLIVSAQTSSFRLQPFLSGLSSPLLTTNARDGSKRLFVVQQGGIIKVVQPSSNVATDFLNITPKVLCCGERGLLGLAFHPQFTSNGYFFVNYTRIGDGATVIARY
ncbi:MAG: PQQ-dependent sugar dehydrogenase, partial [Acidobacteria bacterium]|nr:PQQ-dependent sugar dehydrogenase [Acidobacteriota bacterium]